MLRSSVSRYLLNQTRETYARRDDVREDMGQVMQHLHRIEDKLDKVLQGDGLCPTQPPS